ncbi:MAG: hypothetical protein KDA36_03300 [Planctomycetaceae bacterium]|nr:hypothetical protein [Planctomycetaceae bacterium]
MTKFKLPAVGLLLLLTSLSLGYAIQPDPPADENLRKLQEERISVLTALQNNFLALEKRGLADLDGMSKATIRLEKAKYEAATTDDQRLEALRKLVQVNELLVKRQEFIHERGVGNSTDYLNAQADLLDARIELEKFNQKPDENSK